MAGKNAPELYGPIRAELFLLPASYWSPPRRVWRYSQHVAVGARVSLARAGGSSSAVTTLPSFPLCRHSPSAVTPPLPSPGRSGPACPMPRGGGMTLSPSPARGVPSNPGVPLGSPHELEDGTPPTPHRAGSASSHPQGRGAGRNHVSRRAGLPGCCMGWQHRYGAAVGCKACSVGPPLPPFTVAGQPWCLVGCVGTREEGQCLGWGV